MTGVELVLSWAVVGMATGVFANLLRRKRLPLWDVFSFAVLGAVLCGLIAWVLDFHGFATLFAVLGALGGIQAAPQYIAPAARRKKASWYTAS